MLLDALQKFEWYNEPENVVFRDEEMRVVAECQTDFWQSKHHHYGKDNGHYFFTRRDNNFTFIAKWSFDENQPYAQCGVMLRVDEKNWIKASMMYDNPQRPMLGSSVTQSGYSDWAAQDIPQGIKTIWFKLKRFQGDYLIYYSLDGENYKQIRTTHLLNDMSEVKIGAYICSPGAENFEASLSEIDFIE